MKFKNIKKKVKEAKKVKSPSNSRSISSSVDRPEYFKISWPKISPVKLFKVYRTVLKVFVIFTFLSAVAVVGLDLQRNLQAKQNIDQQRETLTENLNFWINFLASHQNYPDAYFQASVLEYKLGDSSKAKMYVGKGLGLDPNSVNGRKIEQLLK